MKKIFNFFKKILSLVDYTIESRNSWYKRQENLLVEIEKEDFNFLKKISNFSMSTPANHWAIIQSIKHIKNLNLKGDFVECGVYQGGNLMLFEYLNNKYKLNKKIYAYDTFEGMTTPNQYDIDLKNKNASEYKIKDEKWCYATLETVKKNINSLNQKLDNFNFIKGDVCKTLGEINHIPNEISLLRLDTDFYESTLKELEFLFPKLVTNGVLIIDDYGHWKGSRKAVDEYFNLKDNFIWFHRIDYASRLYIKK